ncbi:MULTISPECIES: hypothetical protein [unclassified Streptomyces]|uniref:hypothetical protein n=1 Tax=unclassified Streptomyces TaxID=2593676 RepID=UPI002D219313|nr:MULTISPECIES: hypothetical protein [unclassified Streptomyces]
MSLSQAEADQIRSGVATRQLVQAARPDLLLLPVQSLLPPPGHHRMGHRESLRRIHPGPPRTPHHTRPPPLRGDHLRHPVHIQVLQRLVGVRVQQPPPVLHAHPPPARQVPHRPHRLPGAPRGAQPAPERGRPHHRARHRACGTPASRPVLIFGSSTVNPGSARASTSYPVPHSSASAPRPASLRTTSASARTPPPSCRTGELRHVHSRSTPASGRL